MEEQCSSKSGSMGCLRWLRRPAQALWVGWGGPCPGTAGAKHTCTVCSVALTPAPPHGSTDPPSLTCVACRQKTLGLPGEPWPRVAVGGGGPARAPSCLWWASSPGSGLCRRVSSGAGVPGRLYLTTPLGSPATASFPFHHSQAAIPRKSWLESSLANNKYKSQPGPCVMFFPPRENPGIRVNESRIFLSQCLLLPGLLDR